MAPSGGGPNTGPSPASVCWPGRSFIAAAYRAVIITAPDGPWYLRPPARIRSRSGRVGVGERGHERQPAVEQRPRPPHRGGRLDQHPELPARTDPDERPEPGVGRPGGGLRGRVERPDVGLVGRDHLPVAAPEAERG